MSKALTFSEYFLALPNSPSDLTKENCRKRWLHVSELAEFYNKEFIPSMIVECFSGWETAPEDEFTFLSKSGNKDLKIVAFTFTDRTQQISYKWEIINKGNYQDGKRTLNDMPSTLDQFISDCKRAGVALKWKQDIADLLFS